MLMFYLFTDAHSSAAFIPSRWMENDQMAEMVQSHGQQMAMTGVDDRYNY